MEDCMDFPSALEQILEGKKVRRFEWPDDGTYVTIRDEILSIFTPKDKMLHPLKVSTGDILGMDWVVVSNKN